MKHYLDLSSRPDRLYSWFLGHYHHSGEQEHEHTRLRLLDIMELCGVDERVR